MEENEQESVIINFRKDVKKLKIPKNSETPQITEENTIEFTVEFE